MEYACTDNNKDLYDGHLQPGSLDGSAGARRCWRHFRAASPAAMSSRDSVIHRVNVGLAAALILAAASHTAVAAAGFHRDVRARKARDVEWHDRGLPVDKFARLDCEFAVSGADGKPADWSFECGSPNTLSRQGWKPSTLKPGDT